MLTDYVALCDDKNTSLPKVYFRHVLLSNHESRLGKTRPTDILHRTIHYWVSIEHGSLRKTQRWHNHKHAMLQGLFSKEWPNNKSIIFNKCFPCLPKRVCRLIGWDFRHPVCSLDSFCNPRGFCVEGSLYGEYTDDEWIPQQGTNIAEN